MKAVLDACVLYPTVLREILLGVAARGLYEPLWSDRILREWTRATAKLGPEAVAIAEGEALLAGRGRLVIRPSGTEPLIRVMAEGDDAGQVERVVDMICDAVRVATQ